MTFSESSDTYIPTGYILPDVLDHITKLQGIWKYASLNLYLKEGKKHEHEYELTMIKLWDYLDSLSVDAVERIVVELEGRILREGMPIDKVLRTQLEDYLEVRQP